MEIIIEDLIVHVNQGLPYTLASAFRACGRCMCFNVPRADCEI